MDSNPSQATRADWTGGAGDAATQQQPAAMIEDGIESTRNLALDGDELNNGRVASSIDGTGGDCSFRTNGVRRKKRRKNPDSKSRAYVVGNGHLSVASKKFLFPAVLLLLVASFTSNLVVTAEEDRRHAANARGGDDENAGGPLERILQEEHKSSGLFDNFNRTSGSNEGSKGGAERQANGGGVDEAWLQFVSNGPNDGSQPAIIGGSCKNQLFISLVYDIYPEDTSYSLARIGSNLTFSHKGATLNEYKESYHAYDQIVCMEDGDYNFTIWMTGDAGAGFNGKYELRLATGEVIVFANDDVPDEGVTTLFSLPYNESSISTTKNPAAPAPLPTPTSLNVPTGSPPPGYVGRGWCLDAQDRRYKSIKDDGSRDIRSPNDCLDLCESVPVSDPSYLVGYIYDSKPTEIFKCICLYSTLPDVTDELSSELGVVTLVTWEPGSGPIARSNGKDDSISCYSTSPSFILPTPAPTVSKFPTYDAGCFDFSLSFLLPKVINHGLYYSWSVSSRDYDDVSWGEKSVLVLPGGELSNSIVTKSPLDDRVCLPADSSYELQINIHGSNPTSETVKGTGVWFVLSTGEEHISCGEFPYASVADKIALFQSNAVTFTSSDRADDCVLQPGERAGSGKELLPLQCQYSAFPTTSQGTKLNSSEWTKPECLIDVCNSDPSTCGCQNIDQADYRGTVNSTANGDCSLWSDNVDVGGYSSDAGLDGNQCRNPGEENPYGAWCFVDIGDWGKARYECKVPACEVDAGQPLLSEACGSGSLGFASLNDETEALCKHQHCVGTLGGDAPCSCLLEQWEYNFGSKARGQSECCAARTGTSSEANFQDVQAASCECTLRFECNDLDIGEKCQAYSEYCCEDDECRCDFDTRACRLALENNDENAAEQCAKAEESCCTGGATFFSYGGCKCDFWEPLCHENPIAATCDQTEAACCNNDHCTCDFLTYAADELNYIHQDKNVKCFTANSQVSDLDQELKALQGLYEGTGGESWSVKDGWLMDSDYCNWHGIKCNEEGFVSAVELQRNNLVGKFPSDSLSKLKNLETLDVSENKLTGSMDIVTIVDGTTTYIGGGYCRSADADYYTYFEHKDSVAANAGVVTPEFCDNLCRGDTISTAKSNLVGFEIANYGVDNFIQDFKEGSVVGTDCTCLYSYGEFPLPLKDGVTVSKDYTAYGPVKSSDDYRNAVCYGVTPQYTYVDSSAFLDLRKLTEVNISLNSLSGPMDLLFAPALISIDASRNNFTNVKPFKKFKPSHSSLRSFDLSSNVISQDLAVLFLDKPQNIEEIDLSDNAISGSIQTSEQFDFVRRLAIGSNRLSGALPNLQSKFPNLVDLDLSSNMITGSINGGLTNHLILKTLDLSGNMLTSFDETAVLSNLLQLNHMDLSNNELGPVIPREIGKLKDKLTVLDLSNNNFVSTIPSEIGSLQSDATVRLAGNQFDSTFLAPLSVCSIGHLPDSVGYFDLSDQPKYCPPERVALADFYNEAKGLEWTESTRKVLDIAAKQLLDSPESPTPYKTIAWLDEYESHCLWKGITCEDGYTVKIELNANGLSGRLSSSIGKLKNLRELDVSDNEIKDTIPSDIGLLEQLEYVKLSFNRFQREMPPEVENLKKLKLFQAHGNKITGTVTLSAGLVPDKFSESSFVTDCGSPSLFGDDPGPVDCASCTMCCNEFEECYPTEKNALLEWKDYEDFGFILLGIVLASMFAVNGVSSLWDHRKKSIRDRSARTLTTEYIRQKSQADAKYAIKSMGEGSVYSFFLTNNILAWFFALATVALQFWLLQPFIIAAEFDLSDDVKDLVYTWKCDRVSDKCEDLGDLTWQGWFLFGLLMTAYMGKDIVCGAKMIILSGKSRHGVSQRIRFFVGGSLLGCVSVYIFYASTIYNISIATTNTELIYNAVIILFIMEMDERVFDTIDAMNQKWVDRVTKRKELDEITMSGRPSIAGNSKARSAKDKLNDDDSENDKVYEEMYELKRKLFEMEKSMNSVKEHCGMSTSTSSSTGTTVYTNLHSSDSLSLSQVTAAEINSSGTTVKEKLGESACSASPLGDAAEQSEVEDCGKTLPQDHGTDQKGPQVTELSQSEVTGSSESPPPKQPVEGILRDTSDTPDDQRNGSQVTFVLDPK